MTIDMTIELDDLPHEPVLDEWEEENLSHLDNEKFVNDHRKIDKNTGNAYVSDNSTDLLCYILDSEKYVVYHMNSIFLCFHHSHIEIRTTDQKPVINIGLFMRMKKSGWGNAFISVKQGAGKEMPYFGKYHASKSYDPNPVYAMGYNIFDAHEKALEETVRKYNIINNNCWIYARIFMKILGAKHTKSEKWTRKEIEAEL